MTGSLLAEIKIPLRYLRTDQMIRSFILLLLAASACMDPKGEEEIQSKSLFKKVSSDSSGIAFRNELESQPDLSIIEYLYFYNGAGVAAGDINNDGLTDLYFAANQGPNKLYLNKGDLKFEDITSSSGISSFHGWSTGVNLVDINGDGFQDIYVCQVGKYKNLTGRNLLFINNRDLTFTESAEKWGLDFQGFSTQAAFLDYDRDGDLDMYLLNHSVHTRRSYRSADSRNEFDELAGDRLYENQLVQGAEEFVDISGKAGIYQSSQGYGLGVVAADINEDGWTDIYVGNDFHENDYLYINQKDGTFKETLTERIGHTSRFTMGVDIADMNQDNHPDIFSLDMLPYDARILLKSAGEDPNKVTEIKLRYGYAPQLARNNFQLNKGDGTFSEIALFTETYATDWSWSVLLQDFNNDTRTDIFISNGIYKRPNDLDYINYLSNINLSLYSDEEQDSVENELIRRMPTLKIPNFLYLNKGEYDFSNNPSVSGFKEGTYSNGAVYADFDNDGDLDLAINNVNQKASLLENKTDSLNYLKIKLNQDQANSYALGSKVTVYADDLRISREVTSSRGFMSGVSPMIHFGLGDIQSVDSVDIQWTNGYLERFYDLQKNSLHQLNKKSGKKIIPAVSEKGSYFTLESMPFAHSENRFNDYEQEPLIPHKLSQEGPAFAMSDLNSDGYPEVFLGGAYGRSPKFYQGNKSGFRKSTVRAFENDRSFEDVAAVFTDIDNDGDQDLYVASGGSEYEEMSASLQDRIYLNKDGIFTRLNTPLPVFNGSCVAPYDYDDDGDMDFFVGSRSVPGVYGAFPESVLLENRNNRFLIKQRMKIGMVTDAKWSDLNGDGQSELVAVGEWMPLSIFQFDQERTLINKTKDFGTDSTHGWWNTVEIADINKDGKPDILAGNLGLNSKLKASREKPVHLYVADFDFNGTSDPILFYYRDDQFIPFASRDELIGQLPMLKKNFVSYARFSQVRSIEDLFEGLKLPAMQVRKAFELRSGTFINKENTFDFKPFPPEAQFSPVQDLEIVNINNDDLPDIVIVGNFFGAVSAFGKYDASGGMVITGQGEGKFEFREFLSIPDQNSYRHIRFIEDDLLVISNNGKSLLLKFVGK